MNNDNSIFEKKFNEWVGQQISFYRKEIKMTQDELGNELGLSRTSIVNIEKGRQTPQLYTYWRISDILKVKISQILPINNEHFLPKDVVTSNKLQSMNDLKDSDKSIFKEFYK